MNLFFIDFFVFQIYNYVTSWSSVFTVVVIVALLIALRINKILFGSFIFKYYNLLLFKLNSREIHFFNTFLIAIAIIYIMIVNIIGLFVA